MRVREVREISRTKWRENVQYLLDEEKSEEATSDSGFSVSSCICDRYRLYSPTYSCDSMCLQVIRALPVFLQLREGNYN